MPDNNDTSDITRMGTGPEPTMDIMGVGNRSEYIGNGTSNYTPSEAMHNGTWDPTSAPPRGEKIDLS